MEGLEHYFDKKNIDWEAFATQEPIHWHRLRLEYEQMHENSFELRKKFSINKIRHKYPKIKYS